MKNTSARLEIRLFKFNYKVDYLPYYKSYIIEYKENECVYDILNKINTIENFSYESKEKCNVNINGYFLSADTLVYDIVAKVGNEITINPVSMYRVTNDLIINTDDYDEKLALFSQYLNEEEKESYKEKYKLEYYASHSVVINKEYVGDHSLFIAHSIILKDKTLEKEILDIITNKDTGILYHTSLEKRMFKTQYNLELIFKELLQKTSQYKNIQIIEKEKSELPLDLDIEQYFKGFNIALYNFKGCIYRKIIKRSRANYVHLDSRRDDLALYSKNVSDTFSYEIAGKILLEAKDKNVDFLIVQDKEDLLFFDKEQKKIEKVVNREINLPIITEKQFLMLLEGEKRIEKLGFLKHKNVVSFFENKE